MGKYIFSIIVAIVVLLTCAYATSFSDVSEEYWAYGAINEMVDLGVVNGYPDGTFRPLGQITRAEFAKILVLSLDLQQKSTIKFEDVTKEYWGYEYIQIASNYLTGYNSNGRLMFLPDVQAVREDMAVAIVVATNLQDAKYDLKTLDKFSDKEEISIELQKYIAIAVENGLMRGNADGTFNPQGKLTRAEASQLILNTLTVKEKIAIVDIPSSYIITANVNENQTITNTDRVKFTVNDGETLPTDIWMKMYVYRNNTYISKELLTNNEEVLVSMFLNDKAEEDSKVTICIAIESKADGSTITKQTFNYNYKYVTDNKTKVKNAKQENEIIAPTGERAISNTISVEFTDNVKSGNMRIIDEYGQNAIVYNQVSIFDSETGFVSVQKGRYLNANAILLPSRLYTVYVENVIDANGNKVEDYTYTFNTTGEVEDKPIVYVAGININGKGGPTNRIKDTIDANINCITVAGFYLGEEASKVYIQAGKTTNCFSIQKSPQTVIPLRDTACPDGIEQSILIRVEMANGKLSDWKEVLVKVESKLPEVKSYETAPVGIERQLNYYNVTSMRVSVEYTDAIKEGKIRLVDQYGIEAFKVSDEMVSTSGSPSSIPSSTGNFLNANVVLLTGRTYTVYVEDVLSAKGEILDDFIYTMKTGGTLESEPVQYVATINNDNTINSRLKYNEQWSSNNEVNGNIMVTGFYLNNVVEKVFVKFDDFETQEYDANTAIKGIKVPDVLYDGQEHSMVVGLIMENQVVKSIEYKIKTTNKLKYGDINQDGKITSGDAAYVLQYIAQNRTFTELQKELADVNQDGKVTKLDAQIIAQFIGEIYTQLPVKLDYGDINQDGKITSGDAAYVLQYVAQNRTFTELQKELADVNQDGNVTNLDAQIIAQFVGRIYTQLPVKLDYGDINEDGEVTIADSLMLVQYIAQNRTFTDIQKELADVNQDGEINDKDIELILLIIRS